MLIRLILLTGAYGFLACAAVQSVPRAADETTIYFGNGDERPPDTCRRVGSVDGSIFVEHGSPDELLSLRILRDRALANSVSQVEALGGNSLHILSLAETDYSDRSFEIANRGFALICSV